MGNRKRILVLSHSLVTELSYADDYCNDNANHYNDVIMDAMASPAPRLLIQPFIQGADQIKHQSSASLAFVR